MDLNGRVALVTGAGRRIGRAIAVALAEAGCDLALHFHTSEAAAGETRALVEKTGRRAATFQADLADPQAAAALPQKTADALGSLDVLVNNASVFKPMSLDGFSAPDWNHTLAINLTAPMVLSHAAHPLLKASGGGRIVNLTDISAERPWSTHLAYCASKAGLACLTLALARAMAPEVHVNAVAPGAALFPDDADPAEIKAATRRIPALRVGSAEDIAATVLYLVRDASYVTGTILSVDGGRSIAW